MNYRVLVVGYRKGIIKELDRCGIPHVIYDEKLSKQGKALYLCRKPITKDAKKLKEMATLLEPHAPFTHVIAGTENAVYTASMLRRIFHTRLSVHTTVNLCRDKLKMKEFLWQHNIPMNDFLHCKENMDAQQVIEKLGLPVVIKDRDLSGGRSLIISENPKVIQKAMNRNKIAERFIDAPEYSIESFVNNFEIHFSSITEYYRKRHINIVPARLDEQVKQEILQLNKKVIKALKINWGITHLEIYLKDGKAIFGEIALRPPGGYIMELITLAYGFSSWQAYVAMELGENFDFCNSHEKHTAAVILHPGKGKIKKISGTEAIEKLPTVHSLKMKAKEGEDIQHRVGSGDDIGRVLVTSSAEQELLESLDFIDKNLVIEMER